MKKMRKEQRKRKKKDLKKNNIHLLGTSHRAGDQNLRCHWKNHSTNSN